MLGDAVASKNVFLIGIYELDQCSVQNLVPFQLKRFNQTGATIDTSWGQQMVSPNSGDDMLAQV